MPIPTNANLRRTDLCTCGKPESDAAHVLTGYDTRVGSGRHAFMPHPQPPVLPETVPFQHAAVARINGVWIAEVFSRDKKGRGQASTWLAAVEAAIEDLKEKSGSLLG